MDPYLLICIIISATYLCIGISVLLEDPRDKTKLSFFLAASSLVVLLVLTGTVLSFWQQFEIRLILTRAAYAVGMIMAGSTALFCITFSNTQESILKPFSIVSSVSGVFALLALIPGLMVRGFTTDGSRVVSLPGPLHTPFYVTAASLFVYGLWHLWKRHGDTPFLEERFRIRLIGAGIFIPFMVCLPAYAFIFPYVVKPTPLLFSIGPMSSHAFILLAAYGISRHGLFSQIDLALQHVFSSISAGICVTQADGRIIRHNGQLLELLKCEHGFTGRPIEDLVDVLHSRMNGRVQHLRQWFAEPDSDTMRLPLNGSDSQTLELVASPLVNNGGRTLGTVFMFHDVTEREQLQHEVLASEEKYRTLVENATDIIYTLDLEGKFTFFNKAGAEITGYRTGEWLGKNFRDLVPPGEVDKNLRHAREAYKGNPQRYETSIYHRNGKVLTLWNYISPIVRNGKTTGFSIIGRDITDTKELEQKLKESEEKYRTLVEESENIVYIVQDGYLKFVNNIGITTTGYSADELLNKHFDLLDLFLPDDHAQVAEAIDVLSCEGADSRRLETRLVTKKGEVLDFILTGTPVTYRGKTAIMGVLVDITERNVLREQLVQSEKLASIGQLVSGVAHELNNPLAAIMMYAELLSADSRLTGKNRETARKIFESSERCKRIIQNLLSFARKSNIKRQDLNVNEILEKAIELREYELRLHDIEVQRDYQSDLGLTNGDAQQLQSVFLNLINNASDAMYTANGRGILRVSTLGEADKIVVAFKDDGPGVHARHQDKIFDPFFTTKEVGKGTGLGLSISYGIIKKHEGELFLDRTCKDGARFVIELPLTHAGTGTQPNPDEVFPVPSHDGQPRILVVDDEQTILDLSVDILAARGYSVETAANGALAKDLLESSQYDLVIADIRMPGLLNGIDLYHWARQSKSGMEDRMIFMTGDIVADDTHAFLTETKRPFLSKPFEVAEYLSTVQSALGNSSAKQS